MSRSRLIEFATRNHGPRIVLYPPGCFDKLEAREAACAAVMAHRPVLRATVASIDSDGDLCSRTDAERYTSEVLAATGAVVALWKAAGPAVA